ncbi:response regulator [Bradyrhizobium sp. JYMT SZCCT0180]|nr:response regulator [Bradyrhizobium sp. JYMT SZCCT0180]
MSVLVLVVDDEPDVEALFRQQFRHDLRAQRFVMDFAISAADALSRIARPIEQTLILILSDINMPGMTGLEMLPKVREIRPEVPIIMITAYGDPETKRKAIEGGAIGLLTKPINFTLLREEIDRRLAQVSYSGKPAMSASGTFETCRPAVTMSASGGRTEVAVVRPKRRE